MRKLLIGALVTALSWSSGALAAGPDDGRWSLSLMPTYIVADDERLVDDALRGGQLGLGYALDPSWLVEGSLQYNRFTGTQRATQRGVSVDLLHRWGPQWRVSPYGVFGAGWLRTSPAETGLHRRSGATVSFGVGLMADLAPDVALRTEYRLRRDTSAPVLTDQLISAGLVFSFGAGRTQPAPPPPPPPPPREPEPEPEPAPPPPPPPPPPQPERPCPEPRPGQPVDGDGCALEIDLPGVRFEFDSARIAAGSERVLNEAAATLREYPNLRVEVQGHTDSVGAAEYNQRLSERRARAVRDHLVAQGVSAANLTARGYGEAEPIASNETEDGRARNRRVVLRFIVD